ncbi:MAG: hypothetical protein PUA90_03530 [bacterium]|nr:hypothetical protein [bacterium]
MNESLLLNMRKFKNELKNERLILVEQYNQATTVAEKNEIVDRVEVLDAIFREVVAAIASKDEKKLEELALKYEVKYDKEEKETNSKLPKEKVNDKKSFFKELPICLLAGIAGGLLGHCAYDLLNANTAIEEDMDEDLTSDKKVNKTEKPFEVYGEFNDSSNEKQCENRAIWFYDSYVSQNTGVNQINTNDLMNVVRLTNGEFKLDDSGNITYNAMDIIDAANDIHTIANYASFSQNKNNLTFVPYAPLFEDGSLAQQGATILDNEYKKVVEAIKADDVEAFKEAAKQWGIAVVNIFEHNDFTGKYPSVFQMEPAQAYQLYQVMYATYGTTIFEYGQSRNVNICIPYCTDYNSSELVETPLSEIIYQLNEVPTDWVAKRSGHENEYAENNLSLPEELYLASKNYYDSKYELEIGKSRVLK